MPQEPECGWNGVAERGEHAADLKVRNVDARGAIADLVVVVGLNESRTLEMVVLTEVGVEGSDNRSPRRKR